MIKYLELTNFRNHQKIKMSFNKNFIYIYGENGVGKTAILEAIYFASTTKSFRTSEEKDLINIDSKFAKVDIKTNTDEYEIVLSSKGKRVSTNKLEIKKISEYIGGFNVVVFALEDLELIKGTPGDRRLFMDLEFSQIDSEYLKLLNNYKKVLKQRNILLKKIKPKDDLTLLDTLGNSLYEIGLQIIEKRQKYLTVLNENIKGAYKEISDNKIELIYKPNVLPNDFLNWINNKQEIDIMYETTMVGIHKDDFQIKMNENDAKTYASNGEQRLIVIALKMALLKQIKEIKNKEIVLLLDDVLSELDEEKQDIVLKNLPRNEMIIITSATPCRILENIEIIMLKKERKNE